MIQHYLVLAFRNLRKYALQNAISILGLAAGFACLALTSVWQRHEDTFDNFQRDADRVFLVCNQDEAGKRELHVMSDAFYQQLTAMPDVEAITSMSSMWAASTPQHESGLDILSDYNRFAIITPTFFDFFDLEVVNGSLEPLKGDERCCAVTESYARELFGAEYPIGQSLQSGQVVAVIKDFNPHSILNVKAFTNYPTSFNIFVFVKLHKGVDRKQFLKAMNELPGKEDYVGQYVLVPLSEAHRMMYSSQTLEYEHIRTIRLASVLLVLCALVNYLVLFLHRIRGRRRELALRVVHGAGTLQNVGLFFTETVLVFVAAVVLGTVGVVALLDPFSAYAEITIPAGSVLTQSVLYMVVCLIVCLLVCALSTTIICRSTLQRSLSGRRTSDGLFHNLSIGAQLAISIGMMFCVSVMLKQFHYFRTTDRGHSTYNMMYFSCYPNEGMTLDMDYLQNRLAALPMVEGVLPMKNRGLDDASTYYPNIRVHPEDEGITLRRHTVTDPANPMWGMTVVDGIIPTEEIWQKGDIVLTQMAVKELGLEHPVGQTILNGDDQPMTIVAVVRDLSYPDVLTMAACILPNCMEEENPVMTSVAVSYHPSQRKALSQAGGELMKEMNIENYHMEYVSDWYERALRHDGHLLRLLAIVAGVCLLIALFGIYSIITLACRQRRKEIAVRKVHGAKIGDILSLFIKEYGLIFLIATVVAFVVGTLLMHRWLEGYLHRTPLSWWLYVVIFVGVALLIALCVGSRVWKTARENPADVVKSE